MWKNNERFLNKYSKDIDKWQNDQGDYDCEYWIIKRMDDCQYANCDFLFMII